MKMINFRELLLMLMPTFLRAGVLRAICNSIATTLQYCYEDVYYSLLLMRDTIKWTSERKAIREHLNLLFLRKSYDYMSPNECILIEDGYDEEYAIICNNEDFNSPAEAWDNALIIDNTNIFPEATIIFNVEDKGTGCDLKVVVPDGRVGEINIPQLKNETNRLVFAGLLCRFYGRKVEGTNKIDTEI